MAVRNLTRKFNEYRSQYKPPMSTMSSRGPYSSDNEATLLNGQEEEDGSNFMIESSLPPEWLDIIDGIKADVKSIRENMDKLNRLHAQRLEVKFSDNAYEEKDRDIQIVTNEITRLFQKSENNLKRIATIGSAGHDLPAKERIVRLNVMRGKALEIQSLSKDFRTMQHKFALDLKNQGDFGSRFYGGDEDSKTRFDVSNVFDQNNMNEDNVQKLKLLEENANLREKEIIRIAQSVNELATMFRELNVLVIEQGSILDRIDYNVEQVLVKVQEGKKELIQADKHMSSRAVMCILALFALAAILLGVLIYKKS